MKNLRELMMDDVIKKYGFESKKTIEFCKMCKSNIDFLKISKKYYKLMGCI